MCKSWFQFCINIKIKAKKEALTIVALLTLSVGFAQHEMHQLSETEIDSIINVNSVYPGNPWDRAIIERIHQVLGNIAL